jgi:hypothetical protein
MGPNGTYSIVVDLDNNVVPFGYHQLLSANVLTNSDGIMARVSNFSSIVITKQGEAVPRNVLYVIGLAQISYTTSNCSAGPGVGDAYIQTSSISYTNSNGVATFDAPAGVNTIANVSFWRYDMNTPVSLNQAIASTRTSGGQCIAAPGGTLTNAVRLIPSAHLTFLNALWPAMP